MKNYGGIFVEKEKLQNKLQILMRELQTLKVIHVIGSLDE